MKLLIMYADEFSYDLASKKLENAIANESENNYKDILIAFIHAEEKDELETGIEQALIKHIKYAAQKNNTSKVLLHSFTHLSESKSTPEFAKQLMATAKTRLESSKYDVVLAPFGFYLNVNIQNPGYQYSRIFRSF
ncbi:MAG: hypothetical protein JEZ03_04375 [Bacteroidales bacterium]|nr:hypothetical protein [Bacteroidales bacterium]